MVRIKKRVTYACAVTVTAFLDADAHWKRQ
jgi:hypothetical protein